MSCKSCTVLALIFRPLIHFELTFVYGMRWGGVHLHSFACGYPVVLAPFIEETILSSLNGLSNIVENQLAMEVWVYFWTLDSIPLVYIFILMAIPHCLDYCSFVVSFKIRRCESSNFFFFKIILTIQVPLQSHINLRVSFSISAKKCIGIPIGIAFNPEISLGSTVILKMLCLLHEHGMSYHLFRSF